MQLDDKLFAIKMQPSILVSNKWAYCQLKDEALVAKQSGCSFVIFLQRLTTSLPL